jgi:hypothetical protein
MPVQSSACQLQMCCMGRHSGHVLSGLREGIVLAGRQDADAVIPRHEAAEALPGHVGVAWGCAAAAELQCVHPSRCSPVL